MPEVISARDNPGTLREFETVLILRPDTLQEGILELNNKIKGLIEADEGRMLLVENWGKRRLAYEIRKQLKGIYMYYQFLGHSQLVKEMERNFRMAESVIRYFTTRIDENVDPTARPTELSEEAFLAASATRPDEEELATGYVMTGTGEKIPVSRLGFDSRDDDDDDDDDDEDDYVYDERAARLAPVRRLGLPDDDDDVQVDDDDTPDKEEA
jgi:small subunit ribosomal protein S6